MKKILFCALVVLLSATTLFAMDEDTYVQFVSDSIVVAHQVRGEGDAQNLWIDEMKSMHPDVVPQDLESYEQMLVNDSALKEKVYNRVLENIRSRGYNAHIAILASGTTTVEIED